MAGNKNDRRSETRVGQRVTIRYTDPRTTRRHHGLLVNDSDNGAFIETNHTLPLLTQVQLELPGLVCWAVVCRVHWLRPEERSGGQSSGMAVRVLSSRRVDTDADKTDRHEKPELAVGTSSLPALTRPTLH